MRRILCPLALAAGVFAAGAAHANQVCTAVAPDPSISVALHLGDDGAVQGGEVHWAVPNERPDQPSMVHIVYPLEGDHAASRPQSLITLNAVTGSEIARSSTASVEIVIDGKDMAVRAWDLYGQAVQQLRLNPPAGGLERASFVGAVNFTPSFQDGSRDTDSAAALSRIGKGASTLEVRVLGQDGAPLQAHTYRLFDMPAPPAPQVQAALAADLQKIHTLSGCQAY